MPLITCEMRWLLDGPLPEEVERWFHGGIQRLAPTWREDRYLILPGVADMGIKERAGRLEIKGRLAALGVHAVAPGMEAVAERWSKWSYDATAMGPGCFRGEAVLVGKTRVQRHFLLEPNRPAQEAAQRDLTRRGFSLELTRIHLPAAGEHWSIGVEAAPDDAALLADLVAALRDVLHGFPMPLRQIRSMSYPAWLVGLEPRVG